MKRFTRILMLLLTSVSVCAGCSSLPRIDPTGQRVFAPGGQPAQPAGFGCGLFPRPAFTTPPDPIVCNPASRPGVFADPNAFASAPVFTPPPTFSAPTYSAPTYSTPGCEPNFASEPNFSVPQDAGPVIGQPIFPQAGDTTARLTLEPEQVVARVGGEAVIVATVARGDGNVLGKAPIQWTLDPGGPGAIAEVGGADGSSTGIVNNAQAIGATSMSAIVADRSTPDTEDDVSIQPGQNWISLRSQGEGVSRIQAAAKGANNWDGQTKSAVVYWIDAQWSLPSPTIASPGQPTLLTTVLTRPATGDPITGWLVRYEITGGAAAGFGPERKGGAEVASDKSGQASVQVFPSGQGGQTQIRILIIRPGVNEGEPSRLLVGEGATIVTWSAPALDVQMTGPSLAGVGAAVRYQVEVSNPGASTAKKVVLTDILPPELTLLDSVPPHRVFGEENRWELGDIPAGGGRSIQIQCRTQRRGDLNYCVKARSEGGLERESCVSTRVFAPTLQVEMTGPDTAVVGENAQFRITITNTGPDTLRNVLLNDRYGAGWTHAQGETSPIAVEIGDMAPGAVKRIGLTFVVQQPGELCHVLEVIAGDGQKESRRGCVIASRPAPKPAVQVSMTGPDSLQVGEIGHYRMQVSNTGDAVLTNVKLTHEFGAGLTPIQATEGHRQPPAGGALNWTIRELAPGATTQYEAKLRADRVQDPAVHRWSATSDQQASHSVTLQSKIVAAPRQPDPPVQTPTAPEAPAGPMSGELKVTLADLGDPVKVNLKKGVVYFVEIFNDRNVADRDVQLSIELPPELKFEELGGPARFQRIDGNTILLTPIREMRPQEKLAGFRIVVTAVKDGVYTVKAIVRSQGSPQGVVATQETTAVARP